MEFSYLSDLLITLSKELESLKASEFSAGPSQQPQIYLGLLKVIQKPTEPFQNAAFSMMQNAPQEATKQVLASNVYDEISQVASIASELMGLFHNISKSDLLCHRLTTASKNLLTKKYLQDILTIPESMKEVKKIFFQYIDVHWDRKSSFPGNGDIKILQKGEIGILEQLIIFKDHAKKKSIKSDDKDKIISKIVKRPDLIDYDIISDLFPDFLVLDCLEEFVRLLICRLNHTEVQQKEIQSKINPQESVSGNQQISESNVDSSKGESQILEKLTNETEQIHKLILSILIELTDLDTVTVEIVPLPAILKKVETLVWLWDKMSCNKKVVLMKKKIINSASGVPKSEIQKYLEKKKDPATQLINTLKIIFECRCTELRRKILLWLVDKGKLGLVNSIDSITTDKELTINLCELVRNNGLLDSSTALENIKTMITILEQRGEKAAVISLVQDLIDNTILTRQKNPIHSQIVQILNSNGENSIQLKNIDPHLLVEYNSAIESFPVIKNSERKKYIEFSLQMLKDGFFTEDQNKSRLLTYFQERKEACEYQEELLGEIQFVKFKIEKIRSMILSPKLEGNSSFWGLIFENGEEFMKNHLPRVIINSNYLLQQLQLFKNLIEASLWDKNTLMMKIVIPLNLEKLQACMELSDSSRRDEEVCLRLSQRISNMIDECSSLHTIPDVIRFLDSEDIESTGLRPSLDYLAHIKSPEVVGFLDELWESGVIWPTNITKELNSVFFYLQRCQHRSLRLEDLFLTVIEKCDYADSTNPYIQTLSSQADTYVDFDRVGMVKPKSTAEAAPYIEFISKMDQFWLAQWLNSIILSKVVTRYDPVMGAILIIVSNMMKMRGEVDNELLDYKVFR